MKNKILRIAVFASALILAASLGYWIGYYRVICRQQPTANPDGSVTVVMDGNVYRYE